MSEVPLYQHGSHVLYSKSRRHAPPQGPTCTAIRNCIGWTELPQVVILFIIAFCGTDSTLLVPETVGAIGLRLLETEPEMAISTVT